MPFFCTSDSLFAEFLMAYFSRLTDIVTCNLTRLLKEAADPLVTLAEIIAEIESGMSGARRSMNTAESNERRIRSEVEEYSQQVTYWVNQAREVLKAGSEDQARLALVRKREAEDLVAGLQEQLQAAQETREHLLRTWRALEARLADARRRQELLASGQTATDDASAAPLARVPDDPGVASEIEDELAALKREIEQG